MFLLPLFFSGRKLCVWIGSEIAELAAVCECDVSVWFARLCRGTSRSLLSGSISTYDCIFSTQWYNCFSSCGSPSEYVVSFAYSGVARICCEEGQILKLSHGALTVDFRAGCSSCLMTNSFVIMQYWSKELWVVKISTSWSRRLHNTGIVGSQIWKSRGARAPVPHSWWRHCLHMAKPTVLSK